MPDGMEMKVAIRGGWRLRVVRPLLYLCGSLSPLRRPSLVRALIQWGLSGARVRVGDRPWEPLPVDVTVKKEG